MTAKLIKKQKSSHLTIHLVRVVGARDKVKQLRERIPVGDRNSPGLAPGRSEVAEQQMDGEVPELRAEETAEEGVNLGGAWAGV